MSIDTIVGDVVATKHHDASSGWSVLKIKIDGEVVEVVGAGLAAVDDGATVTVKGNWRMHPKYGEQFRAQVMTIHPPTTADQMKRRLVTYPSIGEATAQRIVDRFGPETWDVMDDGLERLLEIQGIGARSIEKIREHHAKQNGPLAKLQHRLIELDAPASMAGAIYDVYGHGSIEMVERHPYRVATKVPRFGWRLAEKIGRATGIERRDPERVAAGIVHSLKSQEIRGHCAAPVGGLLAEATRLLGIEPALVDAAADSLVAEGVLRSLGDLRFIARMDWTEAAVANAIGKLSTAIHPVWDVGDIPDNLSPGQVAALEAVASSGVVILTGGPGTGKSTVIDNVVKMAKREGSAVILCAPTGRAAKRITEATGEDASTIHRLLRWAPPGGFSHDNQNPLPAGLVVVDESSMLDIRLMDSLLLALTAEHRILLVGDADQLPSVGPGNVLRDLIEAAESEGSIIPVIRLTKVFRQAEGSAVIRNAHRILRGESLDPDPLKPGGEFYFLRAASVARCHQTIVDMASEAIPRRYGLDPMVDVEVLAPMRKDTEEINARLQALYTDDGGDGFGFKDRRFFASDRVMQIRNDYDRGVFNGDIGTVIRIGPEEMAVDFDGRQATYTRQDLGALRLAYAMTIHKGQGSEFPAVIIPMMMGHSVMLRRNLLYTAVTRAKRLCVIVGDPRAVARAIKTADAEKRWTGLRRRVLEALDRPGIPAAANG